VNSASFSLDGKEIITTSDDLTARVYPWETFAPIEDILALAGNRILRELTPEEQQKYLWKRFESSSSSRLCTKSRKRAPKARNVKARANASEAERGRPWLHH